MADDATQAATVLDDADEDRQEAISEILAELRGDAAPEPEQPVSEEPGPADEPLDDSPVGPDGGEQDEESEPAAGPPEGEPSATPEPRQRPAATASPRPLPQASTPRTLVLLHASFLVVIAGLVWLGYRQVAVAVHGVKDAMAARPDTAAAGLPSARAPRPQAPAPAAPVAPATPGAPVAPAHRADEGLRYVQETEKADLLFEKGQYREAATAYRRAIDVMPANWDDGAAAFRLGECYYRVGEHAQAVDAYERVAAAYPNRFKARALFQLGQAYMELTAYAKARAAFYDLLLQQEHYKADAPHQIQKAYYRIADAYRLEAEGLTSPSEGATQ